MAKRKRRTNEEEEETGAETEGQTEGASEETTSSADEHEQQQREQRQERHESILDGLKEKQKEHLEKVQSKLEDGKDATSDIAALQESNLQIQRQRVMKDAGISPIPTGQERSGMGAAGTCVVGPEAHAYIEAAGGEIVDEKVSGHASIQELEEPAPEIMEQREEIQSRREEETADDERAAEAAA